MSEASAFPDAIEAPAFVEVGAAGDVPPGRSASFRVDDKSIAVFNDQGELFAVDNRCPHQGAPLAGQPLLPKGRVRCMLHGWIFSLRGCEEIDELKRYPVRVEGDRIFVSPEPYPGDHEF